MDVSVYTVMKFVTLISERVWKFRDVYKGLMEYYITFYFIQNISTSGKVYLIPTTFPK